MAEGETTNKEREGMKTIAALYRRLRFTLFGVRRQHTSSQFDRMERNLRAEGYLIVLTRCLRCEAEERAAIFPQNVLLPGECGKCHHMSAEVTEILP